MQPLTAFAPILAFFLAYLWRGLYVATAVLMAAMLVLLAVDWLQTRRIPPLHGISTLLVLLLGGATLLFHNRLFIQWKPSVLFWVLSLAFLGSNWIGERTLAERMLSPALEGKLAVSARQWRQLNASSVIFYALLGGANLAVAYLASERVWVYFKLIGLAVFIFVFVAAQVTWLSSRAAPAAQPLTGTPP